MIAYYQIVAFITEGTNLISNAFWLILQLSSCVGQVLVNHILFVLNHLNQFFLLVLAFLRVLCEDTIVFYQDLGEKSSWVASFVAEGISNFADGVNHFSTNTILAATNTTNFLFELTNSLTSSLCFLASLVKTCFAFTGEGFVLIGSSIWLAVTRTPAGILNCIIWIFVQLRNALNGLVLVCLGIINAIQSTIKDCFFYVSNIPCSSFLGLLVGLIIFYSSLKNYKTLISIILQISKKSFFCMSSAFYSLWNGQIFGSNRQAHFNSPGIEDKLCIICQDRLKEVILMPCRHVCLCIQCSLHIARNHRYCPICRSHIQTSMKVYI